MEIYTKSKKDSGGKECAATGCSNTFCNSKGIAAGTHFLKSPHCAQGLNAGVT